MNPSKAQETNGRMGRQKEHAGMMSLGGKYLTFRLSREEYGVEILKVKEIIALMDITQVPKVPLYVRGVINLRGKIIPVVDLRQKFGMDAIADTPRTCIIVVDLMGEQQHIPMGILVDSVSAVLDISGHDIEPAPEYSANVKSDFILGMGKVGGKVHILLDIDRVLSAEEMGMMTELDH